MRRGGLGQENTLAEVTKNGISNNRYLGPLDGLNACKAIRSYSGVLLDATEVVQPSTQYPVVSVLHHVVHLDQPVTAQKVLGDRHNAVLPALSDFIKDDEWVS
jgi:hypothetical protein